RTDGNAVATDARLEFQNLQAVLPGNVAWNEPQMTITASAAGILADDLVPQRLDRAQLDVAAAADKLTAVLLQPVLSPTQATSVWPLKLDATGELGAWLRRIAPWLPA